MFSNSFSQRQLFGLQLSSVYSEKSSESLYLRNIIDGLTFAFTFSFCVLKFGKLSFSFSFSGSLLAPTSLFPRSLQFEGSFAFSLQLSFQNNFLNGIFIIIRYFWLYLQTCIKIRKFCVMRSNSSRINVWKFVWQTLKCPGCFAAIQLTIWMLVAGDASDLHCELILEKRCGTRTELYGMPLMDHRCSIQARRHFSTWPSKEYWWPLMEMKISKTACALAKPVYLGRYALMYHRGVIEDVSRPSGGWMTLCIAVGKSEPTGAYSREKYSTLAESIQVFLGDSMLYSD